jgi:hypothetical protein
MNPFWLFTLVSRLDSRWLPSRIYKMFPCAAGEDAG